MLIKCSECGHDVSDKAASCPNCGAPIEAPIMQTPIEEYYHNHFMMCPKCGNAFGGVRRKQDENHCWICGGTELIDTGIEATEENRSKVVEYVQNSSDVDKRKYQENLKDRLMGNKDPLKMVRYKSHEQDQKETEEALRKFANRPPIPRCPTCQSADIRRISGSERVGSVVTLGLFSKKINKSFKCNNCGYTW